MQPQQLTVTTPTASYPVVIGHGLLRSLPDQLGALGLGGKVWLISDTAVYPHYGPLVEDLLRGAGYTVRSETVPSGETSKDLATAARLYDWLLGGGVERRDTVLALGGGVVGDLAGFVAATALRGIALIQLPTTLLAMVDSAIGGKTGINHPLGKNLIGAFHQPRMVLSDTATLATLPQRELSAGWAEAIKHGVIRDAGLFEELADRRVEIGDWLTPTSNLQPFDYAVLELVEGQDKSPISDLVWRAAKVKVDVVSADERESGERMLLNYGHTLGHAIEAAAGYGTLLHGEAVAIGMHLEAQLAARLGMVDDAMVERQRAVLCDYGLPTAIPAGITTDQILELTLRDKKVRAGKIRWALPTGIGHATIRDDVPEALVCEVVEARA